MNSYQPIIGLEVHIELATKSKMFCDCSADHFGVPPNTHTCPVCLGFPGALPVPNKKAVDWTIMLGLALNCRINFESRFDRKNYFYPDLPKGYQISQYEQPLAVDGVLGIRNKELGERIIRIRRVHLEEDTGKLQHTTLDGEEVALVDFNRSGVPLVEVVTEPDFQTVEEVDVFLKKLQRIIRYLGISNADMEKGSMRLEPSISLMVNKLTRSHENVYLDEQDLPTYRVELKNINSFRFARKALEYEIKRQTGLLQTGETLTQQTRGWDDEKSSTYPQREKEEAHDYRYFPEPDIPPMTFSKEYVASVRKQIPELPDTKLRRFMQSYALSEYDASVLTETREIADYFEKAVVDGKPHNVSAKTTANWIIHKRNIELPQLPAELIKIVIQATSYKIIEEKIILEKIEAILTGNPRLMSDYAQGKTNVVGVIIGQMVRDTKVDPRIVKKLVEERMSSGA